MSTIPHAREFSDEGRRALAEIDGMDWEAQVVLLSGSERDPYPILRISSLTNDEHPKDANGEYDEDWEQPVVVSYADPARVLEMLAEQGVTLEALRMIAAPAETTRDLRTPVGGGYAVHPLGWTPGATT